jgi:hypothetical protein
VVGEDISGKKGAAFQRLGGKEGALLASARGVTHGWLLSSTAADRRLRFLPKETESSSFIERIE